MRTIQELREIFEADIKGDNWLDLDLNRFNDFITVMERVVEEGRAFDMRTWQGSYWENAVRTTEQDLHQCGTAACFGGWVAVSPEWRKRKLKELRFEIDPSVGAPRAQSKVDSAIYYSGDRSLTLYCLTPKARKKLRKTEEEWEDEHPLEDLIGRLTDTHGGLYEGEFVDDEWRVPAKEVLRVLKAIAIFAQGKQNRARAG